MSRIYAFSVAMVLAALAGAPAGATLVDFDDVTAGPEAAMADGYAGLHWDNLWVLDATHFASNPSGHVNGLVSPDYVALNAWGDPAEFSGAPFDFVGAYLTSAWRDGLSVDVEGYRDGTLVYGQTLIIDTYGPVWFPADYANVDTVRFVAYGGTHHDGYAGDGTQFALDNLTYSVGTVPTPGAVLLVGVGTALAGWLRRRHAL